MLAWTDTRHGDPDVYGKIVHLKLTRRSIEMDPEQRLNTDVASADQSSPAIAGNGERGVITWVDRRDNEPRIYARRFGLPGQLNGHEFRVPDPAKSADETGERSVCAVRTDGSFLVLWRGIGRPGLRAQAFDVEAHAVAAPSTIAEAGASACVVALPEERGYLAVWTQAEPAGIFARRVDPSGVPQGEAHRLSRDGSLARDNPACALLDDGRLVVAWDQHDDSSGWILRARFCDREGKGSGDEFALEPSPRHQDWDPYVAPAANDGFLVAWTSGAPDDGSRDVVARFYDKDGHNAGALLPISPLKNEQDNAECLRLSDKSYVVAWEDDISNFDHTYLRRITRNGRELGPIVRMNELPTTACEDRVAPQIAPLGDGLAGTWGDRRRSKGWDVFLRILGPRYDGVEKR